MASGSEEKDNFSIMQHLIDEMDASNHRIDMFSQKFDDDFNKFNVPPPKKPSTMERQFDALYDDAWKSEESDVASLQELPAHQSNDADDSGCEEAVNSAIAEVSNDFLSGIRQSVAQNQYVDSDESRISSDNDFKILRGGLASYARYPETATGLSDTDWNPYGTESDNNQSPRLGTQEIGSDSKYSVLTSFTPLMNSTDINTVTPNSWARSSHVNGERMSDILERTERESTLNSIKADSLSTGLTSTKLYSPVSIRRKPEKYSDCEKSKDNDNKREGNMFNSKEVPSASSDEEKKMVASTSSTGYSSAPTSIKTQGNDEDDISSKPLSVIERAKLMGVPEEILLDKKSTNKLSRTGEFHCKYCNSPEEVVNFSDDQLGKKVKALLTDTTHLSTYDKTGNGSSVDYTVLQRDLQEIQDNLDSFGSNLQGTTNMYDISNKSKGKSKSQTSSEGDTGEIIPSTTTTPEKRRERMMWDFAGELGCLSEHQGLMDEISLETRATGSQRPSSTDKHQYNSDGDETRTSESSTKMEDHHAAADLALAEMSEILPASMRNLDSSTDVDRMVSTFQDKRRQLESRYQQLNNQGLAEKVFRILTNQNPECQANGILSEISADEKDMRTKMVLDMHDKNFNYSSTSSWLDDVNQSFNPNFDVRKKLDMSGLSSVDSTLMFDKSATKGFSALDDAKRLLSSQMMKASERTFNHSIEMRVPQTVQCYPLFVGNEDEEPKTSKEDSKSSDEKQMKDNVPIQETVEDSLQPNTRNRSEEHPQNVDEEYTRSNPSPTSSDQGNSIRTKGKYRPYRPPGSKEVYYTESDTASVADSVTTMESTHIGSDDAKGPSLPSHVLGSRKDPSSTNGSGGIYSSHSLNLSTVREDTESGSLEEKVENNESRNNCRRDNERLPTAISTELKGKELDEKVDTQSAYLTHTHSASTRTRKEEKEEEPTEMPERKRYDINSSSIAAARRDARWAHRRDETDAKLPDNDRGRSASPPNHGYDRMQNLSPTPGIDAARRDAKWAHRKEEMFKNEGPAFDSDRRTNVLPTHGVDAARREARWAHRKDEINQEGDRAMDSGKYDLQENEPISLRIRMTYEDDDRQRLLSERNEISNNQSAYLSHRDTRRTERSSPELRNTFATSNPYHHHHQQGMSGVSSDEHLNSGYGNLSPAFRTALDSGLVRAGSDENLTSSMRDARLSPAFRRALSPELRSSIETRSPLLSRHIERSLTQPPSDFPSVRSKVDYEVDDRFDRNGPPPPTFLARERPLSPPSDRTRHGLYSERSEMLNSEKMYGKNRPRSVSPSYVDRITSRLGSPIERQNEVEKMENSTSHRVIDTADLSGIKSKRKVELTLEGMSSESEADLEMDQEPLTKRAQLLKAALSNEREEPYIEQDINIMWERFKAMNDSGSSSINSSKMEAVAGLLKSPSRHLVSQYVKDREEYRIERQERAEFERERRLQEQQMHKHSSSEDEINERYAELLALKEEERMKRRAAKKKKGKNGGYATATAEKKIEKDGMLFSIPEDRSHDPSPSKSTANTSSSSKQPQKSKSSRQAHVIDPNMFKLRERIAKQKTMVDKEMLKEVRRIEKLKKLENLLSAKKMGKISNETLQNQLDELSSTSAFASSDFSHESTTDIPSNFHAPSDDSTTAKDSSAEMHACKAEKERRQKLFQIQRQTEEERKSIKEKSNNQFKQKPLSEIRLLKLVKEGYLTADEAYKLAIQRVSQSEHHESLDTTKDSLLDGEYGHSGKRHKLYSPYSRSLHNLSQVRHVPKFKYSRSIPTSSSYDLEGYNELDPLPICDKDRKLENFLSYQRQRTRSRTERRPKSHSPSHGTMYSPVRREKSFSPSSTRHSSQPSSRQQRHSASPSGSGGSTQNSQHYSRKVKRNLQESKKRIAENEVPRGYKEDPVQESVSWHIPVDLHPSQWKEPSQRKQQQQPLQEVTSSVTNNKHLYKKEKPRFETTIKQKVTNNAVEAGKNPKMKSNDFENDGDNSYNNNDKNTNLNGSIWRKSSHPRGIPKIEWESVVNSDALASKTNHWEVDPMIDRVQYILNKPGFDNSPYNHWSEDLSVPSDFDDEVDSKPVSKMNLQEAFLKKKQQFISKCSERQKRLHLAKEDRQLQECLRLEREAIFAEQQRFAPPNLYAHPYSDNLYQPKNRILTKQEMKSLTARRYNKLPEVVGKKEEDKKNIEAKLNRLRSNLFNKKVQRDALRKSLKMRS